MRKISANAGRRGATIALSAVLAMGTAATTVPAYAQETGQATQSVFLQSFAASAATAIWAEALARVKKTPAQQYLIVGLIPLIPGGTLYYAMEALITQDWPQAEVCGGRTASFVLGIAAGVSVTSSLLEMLRNAAKRLKGARSGQGGT